MEKKFNKTKYDNDYQKNHYDRIIVNVPKGKREKIKEFSQNKGYKYVNDYIVDLINKDMENNQSRISIGDINQNGDNNNIQIKG